MHVAVREECNTVTADQSAYKTRGRSYWCRVTYKALTSDHSPSHASHREFYKLVYRLQHPRCVAHAYQLHDTHRCVCVCVCVRMVCVVCVVCVYAWCVWCVCTRGVCCVRMRVWCVCVCVCVRMRVWCVCVVCVVHV